MRPSGRKRELALAGLVVAGLVVLLVAVAAWSSAGVGAPAGAQTLPPPTRPPQTAPPPTQPPRTTLPPQQQPTPQPQPTAQPQPQPQPTQPLPFPQGPATTLAPASPSSSGGTSPVLVALLVLVLLGIAAGVAALLRRRMPAPRAELAPAAPRPVPASSPLTQELLEVSRQLTAAASRGDVRRAIVRGALELVPADAAALVGTGPPLTVDAESHPGTLVAERLADGLIGRVADTGEQIVQTSATEPAVRNLPATIIALPLVDRGRVDAVLLLLRAGERTFGEQEVKTLRALAPMAAAVLGSERQTRSAIEESLSDPLTGAGNRRRLDRDLDAAVVESGQTGAPLSLAIVDLDHFKRVNDTYGHPAGDALLKAVVERARTALRPGDGIYRFGGEEFCLLLAGATAAEALEVAERVRANIAVAPFDVGGPEKLAATASIGVATSVGGDVASLLAAADGALYASKEGGRNRVTAAPS